MKTIKLCFKWISSPSRCFSKINVNSRQ